MDEIWKDKHMKRSLLIGGCLTFIALCLFFANDKYDLLVRLIIIFVFPIPFLIILFRTKLTYITDDGIRIGNAKTGDYRTIRLNKPILIGWYDIDSIRIQKKEVNYPLSRNTESFLIIKTKDGMIHESFVAKPHELVKALKDLKMDYLFIDRCLPD